MSRASVGSISVKRPVATVLLLVIMGASLLLSGCHVQRKTITPDKAKGEIQTREQGGNCGTGEKVIVTMLDKKQHYFYACEVTDDYIASCAEGGLLMPKTPSKKYMYADIEKISFARSPEPCWMRGVGIGHVSVGR